MSAATRSVARLRALVLALAALLAALALATAAPDRAEAARVKCAGTFRVLHDDHVGRLSLPKGNYRLTILSSGRPSCAQAAALFTRFLEDWDGKLPGGWKVGVASKVFYRAPGVGFHVARIGRNSGGGEAEEEESGGRGHHPANGAFCPGTFRVLHNDRIGPLRLQKGPYWIILLQRRGLSCKQASRLFTRFLDDFDGNLPPPWVLEPQTASFFRSASGVGFRVKPVR
ncbi:MAG: hypothetical protein R2725_15790 [Solirubrobacterales bacterium]